MVINAIHFFKLLKFFTAKIDEVQTEIIAQKLQLPLGVKIT